MEPDEVHAFLRSRRSIRRFQFKPVPSEIINRILETASYAPSAHNRQPWRVVNVRSMERREQMARAMGGSFRRDLLAGGIEADAAETQVKRSHDRIVEAPVLLVLCFDADEVDDYGVDARARGEQTMGMQSVALFGCMILLAAQAEGLGGVWVCAPLFAQIEVQTALDLPASWQPQGMILLGYPADTLQIPAERRRKSVSEFTKAI